VESKVSFSVRNSLDCSWDFDRYLGVVGTHTEECLLLCVESYIACGHFGIYTEKEDRFCLAGVVSFIIICALYWSTLICCF